MKNMYFPNFNSESILADFKKLLEKRSRSKFSDKIMEGEIPVTDLNEVRECLSTAQKYAPVGTKLGPMTRMKGWKRKVARIIGKVVLRLGNIISADQRLVNQSLIDSIHLLCQKVEEQERNINHLLRQRLSDIISKETEDKMQIREQEIQQRMHQWIDKINAMQEKIIKIDEIQEHIKILISQLDSLTKKLGEIAEENHSTKIQLRVQERRLTLLLEEARKRLTEPLNEGQLKKFTNILDQMNDSLYLAFEDIFRGSREEIKKRQRVYLSYIREAGLGQEDSPILDIGCGRGEWLELLKEEGLVAKGVDLNIAMVELSRDYGLEVEHADVFEYLSSIPDATYGVVTGFHIIEHLPFEQQLKLLDEILRVLKPGGFTILETPNPENILVGACNFYSDPTHKNPIFPETLKFLAEMKGFTRVEIKKLNPRNELFIPEDGSIITKRFNELFYGPQDYSILGWKV